MEIIFISSSRRRGRRTHLGGAASLSLIGAVIALCAGTYYLGYRSVPVAADVANEIEVRLPSGEPTDDDIARISGKINLDTIPATNDVQYFVDQVACRYRTHFLPRLSLHGLQRYT